MTAKRTRYVTVRLTLVEAKALLLMANSGDYQDEGEEPKIKVPSNRAEAKIVQALAEYRRKLSD